VRDKDCGAGSKILGSVSGFKHLDFLALAPQHYVRKQAVEIVLPNSLLKCETLARFILEKKIDALENTIKFHQTYVWIQASFL